MLTKMLLTILVVFLVWWFVSREKQTSATLMPTDSSIIRRYIPIAILIFVGFIGFGFGIWSFYDSYQTMTVTIVSPMDGQSVSYQVRKKDIDGDQLLTIDGVKVRVSSQERMIISPN